MRVLHVNDYPPRSGSGVEVYLSRIADGLRRAGHDVEVWAADGRAGHLSKVLDLWDPWARRRLSEVIEDWRPDVVHFHNFLRELSPAVLLAGPRRSRPAKVMTLHDYRLIGRPDKEVRGLMGLAKVASAKAALPVVRRAIDATIVVSRSQVEPARRAGLREVVHIPVPAPPPARGQPVEACVDVVYAGRLTHEKGVHVLIEAWQVIGPDFPDSRLLIIGDGPARASLERAAQTVDRVVFAGAVPAPSVAGYMAGARTVVVPSLRSESAGLVVAEAALAGRPVIVSADPALRELIDDSGGGLVVEIGSVDALARAMTELLSAPAQAAAMGEAACRLAANRHNVADIVGRIEDVYEHARRRGLT